MTKIETKLYGFCERWLRRVDPCLCNKHKILIDAYPPDAAMFRLHGLGQAFRLPATIVNMRFSVCAIRKYHCSYSSRHEAQYFPSTWHNCKAPLISPNGDNITAKGGWNIAITAVVYDSARHIRTNG